jgi:hypothetical protein
MKITNRSTQLAQPFEVASGMLCHISYTDAERELAGIWCARFRQEARFAVIRWWMPMQRRSRLPFAKLQRRWST